MEPTWGRRVVREAIEIRVCNPSLNQGVGKFSLSALKNSSFSLEEEVYLLAVFYIRE